MRMRAHTKDTHICACKERISFKRVLIDGHDETLAPVETSIQIQSKIDPIYT